MPGVSPLLEPQPPEANGTLTLYRNGAFDASVALPTQLSALNKVDPEEAKRASFARIPFGEPGRPEDVAEGREGEGKMAYATKISFDKKKNTVELENYSSEPVRLQTVKTEKG